MNKILSAIFNKRMLICIFTGFSSGLPLYVLFQLFPAWLRDCQIDLTTIGLFSLISFPYTWKFLWSPLMDHFVPPFLGRRKGWALITQIGLLLSLLALGPVDPRSNIELVAVMAGVIAVFSASQDIVLDAYRRELLPDEELGIGNSFFVNAYRISSLVPGSLALILADSISWGQVHAVVASFMLVGILTTFWMPEPEIAAPKNTVAAKHSFIQTLKDALVGFFELRGVRKATLILLFMLLYKLGDNMATALATPFYLDLGFSKSDIGTVAKVAALWASIVGGLIGGILMIRIGIARALWLFGVVQVCSILGFAYLSSQSRALELFEHRKTTQIQGVGDIASFFELTEQETSALKPYIRDDGAQKNKRKRPVYVNELNDKVLLKTFQGNQETLQEYRKSQAQPILQSSQQLVTALGISAENLQDHSLEFGVRINFSSQEALQRVPDISAQEAQAVIDFRREGKLFDTSISQISGLTYAAEKKDTPQPVVVSASSKKWLLGGVNPNTATSHELGQLPSLLPSAWLLFWVVSFEYLGVGLGTAAFVAFIASVTDKRYTATQFALLTSLMGLPRTFANASTGFIVESIGYTPFFFLCTLLAIPGMILLIWVAPWGEKKEKVA